MLLVFVTQNSEVLGPRRYLEALKNFLQRKLDYELHYREYFEDDLREILRNNLAEDQAEHVAQTLAHDCADNKPDAVDNVNEILGHAGLHMDELLDGAQAQKAEELVDEYVRHEPGAVKLTRELLAGRTLEALIIDGLGETELDYIERIDHLITIAEGRRNASLREIDRRRASLSDRLRRSVQEIEADEFKVIETRPVQGKNAA